MNKLKYKTLEYAGILDKDFDDWFGLDLSTDNLCNLYSDQEPYRGNDPSAVGNHLPFGKYTESKYKAKLPPKSERYYQRLIRGYK